MEKDEFRSRLIAHSKAIIEYFETDDPDALSELELASIHKGTLLSDPASSRSIRMAESRLGVTFPEDMRSFFELSNGMCLPGLENHSVRLVPVEEIGRFRDVAPGTLGAIVEIGGGTIGSGEASERSQIAPISLMPGDVTAFRQSFPSLGLPLMQSIALSEVANDAVVLLCPFSDYGPGVLETWVVGPWIGCIRYRSFGHFLLNHLASFLDEVR